MRRFHKRRNNGAQIVRTFHNVLTIYDVRREPVLSRWYNENVKLGIKVGPQNDSIADLNQTRPQCAEVWFNVGQADDYNSLFADLSARRIDVGLHFWGLTDGGISANFAYPDQKLIDTSMALIKKTIDVAARHSFYYVNIHPGGRSKIKIDFTAKTFQPVTDLVPLDQSKNLFLENVFELDLYTRNRGVILTVETVPTKAPRLFGGTDRTDILDCGELPAEVLIEAARRGLYIANDFGHTTAIVADNPAVIWQHAQKVTQKLLPQTKLIHLGFVVPPYNGTDFHDMLDNPLLDTDEAVPNKQQMIALLKLFQTTDVWVITEPREDHVKNYFLAQKLLAAASA